MFREYRNWLQSELTALAQSDDRLRPADWAKRALEQFDTHAGRAVVLEMTRAEAIGILTVLEMLAQKNTSLDPSLSALREKIREELIEKSSGGVQGAASTE